MIVSVYSFFSLYKRALITVLVVSLVISLMLRGTVYGYHFVSIGFIFVSYMLLIYFNRKNFSRRYIKPALFFVSLLYGVISLFAVSYLAIYITGEPFVALDDKQYDLSQHALANELSNSGFSLQTIYTGAYSGYPNMGGILMWWTGISEWYVPRIFTVILMSFSSLIVYQTIKYIYHNESMSTFVATLFAFSPLFSFYSVVQLKDYCILFFLTLFFWSVVALYTNRSIVCGLLTAFISLVCLLFFRPAILLSVAVTILLFLLIIQQKSKLKYYTLIFVFVLLVYMVLKAWDYTSGLGLISSYDDYFQPRFDDAEHGTKVIGESSAIKGSMLMKIAGAPLYILLSPFLPIPDSVYFANPLYPPINYEFTSCISLYALLPFIVCALYRILRNRKKYGIELFFVLFFIVYKVGQSLSMSVFGLRQSLPSILAIVYILPVFFDGNIVLRQYKYCIVLCVVMMFSWTFIRFFFRN